MTIYNVHEAKTHFSKLIKRVLDGEEVVIAKAGKPVARLSPFVEEDLSPRVPGIDKGKVTIMPDFDAPLPEFEE
jgi:prevent-host-death family protein